MIRYLLALLSAGILTAGAGDIPAPGNRTHPGAAEAPVSDPRTYPDEAGFRQRADVTLRGLAADDLGKWRRGYFSGGDPGKYLPGHAMARLLLDPADAEARRYMNDDRSCKEHYHFAAVNWGRYLPLFGAETLTEETQRRLAEAASAYSAYVSPGGTENHKTMWWTTANVLPHYLVGKPGLGRRSREDTLAGAKEALRRYVKGLYAAGQGEWDSPTYLMFGMNGMLNIYDFSPDPECRLLAKAALDWFGAAYALKYRDGIFCGPNQRGFYDRPGASIADQTGYLWWGSSVSPSEDVTKEWRYTLHAITSSWRPNAVLCAIARKQLPGLPVEQRNSHPDYWHGLNLEPEPGRYRETLYLGRTVTMGSLWNGHGGQMTRFQVVAETPAGAVAFTAGHPRRSDHTGKKTDTGYRDGIGRYDQVVQAGSTAVILTQIPDDEPVDNTFFSLPPGVDPTRTGEHFVVPAGSARIVVTPVGGEASVGLTELTDKEKAENEKRAAQGKEPRVVPDRVIRQTGRRTAWVIRVLEASEDGTLPDAAEAARENPADTTGFRDRMSLRVKGFDGRELTAAFNPDPNGDSHGDRPALVTLDGQPLPFDASVVYGGPFVRQQAGILTVTDGRTGYTVDFNGDLPVYRDLQ